MKREGKKKKRKGKEKLYTMNHCATRTLCIRCGLLGISNSVQQDHPSLC